MPAVESLHLGDGAYVSRTDSGDCILTADHHDPKLANGAVYLGQREINRLREFLEGKLRGDRVAI